MCFKVDFSRAQNGETAVNIQHAVIADVFMALLRSDNAVPASSFSPAAAMNEHKQKANGTRVLRNWRNNSSAI